MPTTSKADGMLVTDKVLRRSRRRMKKQLETAGVQAALASLAQTEPGLSEFLRHNGEAIAGRLALAGGPPSTVQGVFTDLMAMALTAVLAVRRGQFEYWRDTMTMVDPEVELAARTDAAEDTALDPVRPAAGVEDPAAAPTPESAAADTADPGSDNPAA